MILERVYYLVDYIFFVCQSNPGAANIVLAENLLIR